MRWIANSGPEVPTREGTADKVVNRRPIVLVVDDERPMRELLKSAIGSEGYDVIEACDRQSMFATLERQRADLITLDLGLGQEDGLMLAREARKKWNIPIVMITGRSEPIDRVMGLECGADDYIAKPFHVREVTLRIKSVLERYALAVSPNVSSHLPYNGNRVAFDHGMIDFARHEVAKTDGRRILLTETEFDLLRIFVSHPGRIISRDELWKELRGRKWDPLDRTIDGHVAHLRSKIEPVGEAPVLIKSVRGVGYVFVGEVRPVEPLAATTTERMAPAKS